MHKTVNGTGHISTIVRIKYALSLVSKDLPNMNSHLSNDINVMRITVMVLKYVSHPAETTFAKRRGADNLSGRSWHGVPANTSFQLQHKKVE